MKKIIFIAMLLWGVPALSQIKSATLRASGLTCSMCSKAIFKALEKVSFVKSIDADVEKSRFMVLFKENDKRKTISRCGSVRAIHHQQPDPHRSRL